MRCDFGEKVDSDIILARRKNPKISDLSNRTALITGAAGLLGRAHAKALLDIDANVILTDVNKGELTKHKTT